MLFSQSPLTYLALLAVPATAFLLYRTGWGLDLRTVGENPRAADAAGISVAGRRCQAVVIGSALMGVGGAYLTIDQFNAFTFGVISGRGWVSIALVVFGQWRAMALRAGALSSPSSRRCSSACRQRARCISLTRYSSCCPSC